ncbi:MAG: OmpA family protein [Cetobacterium sp.]
MLKKKLNKIFILAILALAAQSTYSQSDTSYPNLNYELKVGITPFESYGSSTYSERFDNGIDFGIEVYKPFQTFSLGFGSEVKREVDSEFIVGETSRLYTYYFLGKKKITDSYSLVTRLGRTSQKEFDSKYYGAIGLEKNINRVNIQLLLERTKLKNSFNDKDYTAVGLKVGYIFGDQYQPELTPPIVIEETIMPTPIPVLTIQGDELTGGYPAYKTEVPENQKNNISDVVQKLNEHDKPGILELSAYSDNTGSKDINVQLADERMNNLIVEFVNNGLNEKIKIEKIDPETTVKEVYKFENDTFENRQLNRRIEVTFIED